MEKHRWKLMLKDKICLFTLNATMVMINESIPFKKAQNIQTKTQKKPTHN